MSKALQRAARINQEGAEFLEVGQNSKALKCFRAALKQVNESCQLGLSQKLPNRGGITSSFCSSTTPVRLSSSSSVSCGEAEANYSQVFHFNPEGKLSVQKQSYCSAVLIFNCALTLHHKGHSSMEEGDMYKSYKKALLFYAQAMALLRPYASNSGSALPDCFEMMQEIMKNQAGIYYKIHDLGSVQRVMEELVQLTAECHGAFANPKTHTALSA